LLAALQDRGHEYELVSSDTVIVDEKGRKAFRIKRTWNDVDPDEVFDGIAVVSGHPGDTGKLWKDTKVHRLVASMNGSPVAAICAAVPSIRGIAEGHKVAAYPLVEAKRLLRDAGAIVTTLSICVDGKLVTAEHQGRAKQWANYFCDLLEGIDVDFPYVDSGYSPTGKPRRPIPEVERLRRARGISDNI
jgi:putative intracellular protease/amidase